MMIRSVAFLFLTFILVVSAAAFSSQTGATRPFDSQSKAPQQKSNPQPARRANELTLAGLRPGKDTLAVAEKKMGAQAPAVPRERPEMREALQPEWFDACARQSLRLELGENDIIQTVTVTGLVPQANCFEGAKSFPTYRWKTGRGLAVSQACGRAVVLYGQPASRAPSTQAGLDLELLYYEFDWAGPDVPQVLEISCDRKTGRVLQMTLSFPSL